MVQNRRDQARARTFVVDDQPHDISSPESVTSWGEDVIKGIQPRFVYQTIFPNYYEPIVHWEVDENTNVDVFEENEENYPRSFKYAETQVNALDEVP